MGCRDGFRQRTRHALMGGVLTEDTGDVMSFGLGLHVFHRVKSKSNLRLYDQAARIISIS